MDGNSSFTDRIHSLARDIIEYLKLRLEYLEISGTELLIRIVSGIILFQIFSTLFAFAILFLTTSFTLWLGRTLDNYSLAFLITSAIYMILALVILAFRRTLIIDKVTSMILKLIEKTREGKNE